MRFSSHARTRSKRACAFDQPRGASGWGPGFLCDSPRTHALVPMTSICMCGHAHTQLTPITGVHENIRPALVFHVWVCNWKALCIGKVSLRSYRRRLKRDGIDIGSLKGGSSSMYVFSQVEDLDLLCPAPDHEHVHQYQQLPSPHALQQKGTNQLGPVRPKVSVAPVLGGSASLIELPKGVFRAIAPS